MEREDNKLPVFMKRFAELSHRFDDDTKFAEALGFARQTVAHYKNGRRLPKADALQTIAERCNVSVDWLLGRTLTPTTDPSIRSVCDFLHISEETAKGLQDELRKHTMEETDIVFNRDFFASVLPGLFSCVDASVSDEVGKIFDTKKQSELDKCNNDDGARNQIEAKYNRELAWIVYGTYFGNMVSRMFEANRKLSGIWRTYDPTDARRIDLDFLPTTSPLSVHGVIFSGAKDNMGIYFDAIDKQARKLAAKLWKEKIISGEGD